MRVVKAEIKGHGKKGKLKRLELKINNGVQNFLVEIEQENLSYEHIVNHDVIVKVVFFASNCCSVCPMVVLESGKNEEDDKEIVSLLDNLVQLMGEDLKKAI